MGLKDASKVATYVSLTTLEVSLSSRKPMNLVCLRWSAPVDSKTRSVRHAPGVAKHIPSFSLCSEPLTPSTGGCLRKVGEGALGRLQVLIRSKT
jgi:hypothetical protein